MFKWIVKKYLKNVVNQALSDAKSRNNVDKYRRTAHNAIKVLDKFLTVIEDYNVSEKEIDDLCSQVEALFQNDKTEPLQITQK